MFFQQPKIVLHTQNEDQDMQSPASKYFTGRQSALVPQPAEKIENFKRSNSLNRFNINRREIGYNNLLYQNLNENQSERQYTEQELAQFSSQVNNKQIIGQIPLKFQKKNKQTLVQPKQIELNVESNYHLASVYYAQSMKSLLQTPRYQTSQSEKDYLQKLNMLNNSQRLKNKDYLLNSPLNTRPSSQCFRIAKKGPIQLNQVLNSRKNSKCFVDEEYVFQSESLEQNNLMTSKSQSQILNTLTSTSIIKTNPQTARQETNSVAANIAKSNLNPITNQIEIQGSNYRKQQEQGEDNFKNNNFVLKNEFVVSKLKSSTCLKDKTQINQLNFKKIIQLQRQYHQNLLNNNRVQNNIQENNAVQDKEQEDNQRKYFELIQSSIKTIELEQELQQDYQNSSSSSSSSSYKLEEVRQKENKKEDEDNDDLKLFSQSLSNSENDILNNKTTSINIFSNNDLSQPVTQSDTRIQSERNQNQPISNGLIYDQAQFDDKDILSNQKLNTNTNQMLNYQQYNHIYYQKTNTTNQNFKNSSSKQLKNQNENTIPFKSFSKIIQMNQDSLKQNMKSLKFDSQRLKRKNLILEQVKFDSQKYKKIQIKIEQTQNRLLNNNYL